MLKIQTLASGSRGNATYIASGTTQILVDVGLTLPQLLRRMDAANIEPATIDAILITHEHGDHVAGLSPFIKRFASSLHLHEQTADIFSALPRTRVTYFNEKFTIGDIEVDFFPVPHDSKFCFGYTFRNGSAKIAVATDLGRVTPEILNKLRDSQIVMLESNHDTVKLSNNTKYPVYLKRRITSSVGHLSNAATCLAAYELAKSNVQQIILAHLSEQNNSPALAYSFVRDFLAGKGITEGVDISVDVAKQDEISLVFQID